MPGLNFFYKRNATHGEAENFAGAVYHVRWGFRGFARSLFFDTPPLDRHRDQAFCRENMLIPPF